MVTRMLEYDANDPRWGDTSSSVTGESGDLLQIPTDHSAITVDFGVVATACTVSLAVQSGATFNAITEDIEGTTYPRASFTGAEQRSFRLSPGSTIRITGTGVTYAAVSYRDKVIREPADVPGLTTALAGKREWLDTPGASGTFDALVKAGSSTAIHVLGDSTGVGVTRWPYLLAGLLTQRNPTFTVRHRQWNDTSQVYEPATVIQSGAAGARYARFPGGTSSLYIPDNAFNRILGDIDLRINFSLDAFPVAADTQLMTKYGSAGNRGWNLYIAASGKLVLLWSADGTAYANAISSVNLPGTADVAMWVRCTRSASTGSVMFYTSTDGVTWTQLGTTQSSTPCAIFATTQNVLIGSYSSGMVGKVYEARALAGIGDQDGIDTLPRYPDAWNVTGSITFEGAPVIDIINGSITGSTVGFIGTVPRVNRMLAFFGQSLILINSSHNEVGCEYPYLTYLDAFAAQVAARYPYAGICLITQNPRVSPATGIKEHAVRCALMLAHAKSKGWSAIDTYTAFATSSTPLSTTVESAGIHPTDAGSVLEAAVIDAALSRRV